MEGLINLNPTKGKTYEQDQIQKAVQGTSRFGIRNEETARPRASTQGGEANQKPGKTLPTVKSARPFGRSARQSEAPLLDKAGAFAVKYPHADTRKRTS